MGLDDVEDVPALTGLDIDVTGPYILPLMRINVLIISSTTHTEVMTPTPALLLLTESEKDISGCASHVTMPKELGEGWLEL